MLDCEICPHFKIGYVPDDCFECEFLQVRMRVIAVGVERTRKEEKEKERAAADKRMSMIDHFLAQEKQKEENERRATDEDAEEQIRKEAQEERAKQHAQELGVRPYIDYHSYCPTCDKRGSNSQQPGYCSHECHERMLYILAAVLADGNKRIAYRIFDAKETCFTCQSRMEIPLPRYAFFNRGGGQKNDCRKGHRTSRRELGFCEDWQRIALSDFA